VVVGAATDWEIRDFGANGQLGTKWSLLPSAMVGAAADFSSF
jgi:hypothetical protein